MKKALLVLLLVLGIVTCASAQMVFYQDEATLLWDPVTTDAQGDPLLPTDTVEYAPLPRVPSLSGLRDSGKPTVNGLFCAVATTGVGNRVMTSPDGITWTIRTSAADNYSVCKGKMYEHKAIRGLGDLGSRLVRRLQRGRKRA